MEKQYLFGVCQLTHIATVPSNLILLKETLHLRITSPFKPRVNAFGCVCVVCLSAANVAYLWSLIHFVQIYALLI